MTLWKLFALLIVATLSLAGCSGADEEFVPNFFDRNEAMAVGGTATPKLPEVVGFLEQLGATPEMFPSENGDITYGVHYHPHWGTNPNALSDAEAIALIKETLNPDYIRIGPSVRLMYENSLETESGWYINQLDDVISRIVANDMKVLFFIGEIPCLAAYDSYLQEAKQSGEEPQRLSPFCEYHLNTASRWDPVGHEKLVAQAAAFLVDRYGDAVLAFEVWNEPNMARFWGDSPNAGEYMVLLRHVSEAIREVNPDLPILGGSVAGTDVKFIEQLYEYVFEDDSSVTFDSLTDGLAIHPYTDGDPVAPGSLYQHIEERCLLDPNNSSWSFECGLLAVMKVRIAHGDYSKLWFTEIGFSSLEGYDRWGQLGAGANQAQYLSNVNFLIEEFGYSRFVASLSYYRAFEDQYDSDTPDYGLDREAKFGLITFDGEPKLAACYFNPNFIPNGCPNSNQ